MGRHGVEDGAVDAGVGVVSNDRLDEVADGERLGHAGRVGGLREHGVVLVHPGHGDDDGREGGESARPARLVPGRHDDGVGRQSLVVELPRQRDGARGRVHGEHRADVAACRNDDVALTFSPSL